MVYAECLDYLVLKLIYRLSDSFNVSVQVNLLEVRLEPPKVLPDLTHHRIDLSRLHELVLA